MQQLAAIYARVSTMQQEEEATIESQIAALERYAKEHHVVVDPSHYYLDESVSGARLQRPALDRLRDAATEGRFGTVLCLSPDRFARQFAHQCVLLDELKRVGVTVKFLSQPATVDGAQGQLLLGIQGLFSEYERAMITERMRRGKLYKMRTGQLANPRAPYGYRYIPVTEPGGGRWVIWEERAEIVRLIFHWYTSQSLKLVEIVQTLNEMGITSPKKDGNWSHSTLRAILQREAYTGISYYNRTRRCYDSIGRPRKHGRGRTISNDVYPRPREEWVTLSVPAIIESELFERAQAQLEMNKKHSVRNNKKHFYRFRGLLVCHVCGHTLTSRTNYNGAFYYCQYGGVRRNPDVAEHSCTIQESVLEPLVWQQLVHLLQNPTLIADAWHDQFGDNPADSNELARLQSRQRKLDGQWKRLLDLFQDGLIEKDELQTRKVALDRSRETLSLQIKDLERKTVFRDTKAEMVNNFSDFAEKILASLEHPSPQLQQEVMQLLIDHILIEEDAIVIKHIVPSDEDCRLMFNHR